MEKDKKIAELSSWSFSQEFLVLFSFICYLLEKNWIEHKIAENHPEHKNAETDEIDMKDYMLKIAGIKTNVQKIKDIVLYGIIIGNQIDFDQLAKKLKLKWYWLNGDIRISPKGHKCFETEMRPLIFKVITNNIKKNNELWDWKDSKELIQDYTRQKGSENDDMRNRVKKNRKRDDYGVQMTKLLHEFELEIGLK